MSVILERRRSHALKRSALYTLDALPYYLRIIYFLYVHYKKTRGDIHVTAKINTHQI